MELMQYIIELEGRRVQYIWELKNINPTSHEYDRLVGRLRELEDIIAELNGLIARRNVQ